MRVDIDRLINCVALGIVLGALSIPVISGHGTPHRTRRQFQGCRKPVIEITVSPLVTESTIRLLELSWEIESVKPGDRVALYDQPPSLNVRPLFTREVTRRSGWVRTNIQEKKSFHSEPEFKKRCLGFWAAFWSADSSLPVAATCLSSNPRWMEESKDIIQDLKLRDMFLPGTHDSAAFQIAYAPFKENRYSKYIYAQDETVMDQLIHGARYLDFRIGFYNGVWWLNHGIARVHPLEHVLDDIKSFLDNTNEIVVIDLHAFPVGMEKHETHILLVEHLKRQLGKYMATPSMSWETSLRRIWAGNKTLILAYNERSIVAENYESLWWPVSQKWPNVRTLQQLQSYFQDIFKSKLRYPWAAMAELTANAWGVISDQHGGLRKMAESVNHDVSTWFRGDWGSKCNAVAVDFIRSTSIVNSAIMWNKRRAQKTQCDVD